MKNRRLTLAALTLLSAVAVPVLLASPAAAAGPDPVLTLDSGLHLDAVLASLISVK